MPYNLTSFIIRQPRVSSVNEARTLPPYTQGTVVLSNAFTIRYTGSGSTCLMHLTGQKLTTLVNNDRSHADNLNIVMTGKTLQELVDAITTSGKYAATLQGAAADRATISGVLNQSIMTTYQVQYAVKSEYLVEVDQTGKLGSATIQWTKNGFTFSSSTSQWGLNSGVIPNNTGVLVPVSGVTSISQGAQIVFQGNSDNPSFDIASLKTKNGETLVQSAGSGIQFVNMSVLSKIVPGTLQLVINEVPAVQDQDYSISLTDNRINFLKGVTNESQNLIAESSYVNTNVIGINGVILDSIQVKKNDVSLVLNTDYYPQVSTDYQGKSMGTGRVYFTKTYSEDPVAEYVLTTESSIYGDDLVIKKNGVVLAADQYLIVFEAGFLNLNEPLFPGDILTASYSSTEFGDVTDEILAGTPATITSVVGGPFTISSGDNDTLIVNADGNLETIYLPLGNEVSMDDVIDQYNDQASFSLASKNTAGNRIVITSRTPGASSTLEIGNGTGNQTLGFFSGTSSIGEGSTGGEFAFTLANAPVAVSSFTAPAGGDTFILKDFNLASNYPTDSLIAIQSDLYAVDSATTDPFATLYSSSNATSFRISAGINDTFRFSLDGSDYTEVVLTAGDRTPEQICDDINLTQINSIASVVSFNGYNRIRLKSSTNGLLGNIKIGNGTANDTIGFKTGSEDTGLLNTVVKIKGTFRMDYENPILRTTRRPVIFNVESNQHEKAPSGVSSIFFPTVDLSSLYKANTLIRIGTSIYTVVSSQFVDNKTEVKLTSNLTAPLYTTDTVEKTARPVFAEGETTIVFQEVPISDLPVVIKNNGTTLVDGTDYTLNGDGTATLSDSYKLNSSSNITATYTVFDTVEAGTNIKLSYRFFSSLNEGSKVTASYTYFSRDQFFFDIVYQSDLAEAVIAKLQEDAAKAVNPSSSGFSASAGGEPANSESGNETPKLSEYKHRYNESIGYAVYSWLDTRIKALTDERGAYNGVTPGADNGYLTEAQIQEVINSSSRLFPTGYNDTLPKRIPFLDGLGQNDDGSTTGGFNSSYVANMITQRDTTIPNENSLIDALLALPTSGTANVTGTTSISSVTFYNGLGTFAANNVLNVTVNGNPITVTFTATSTGTVTSSATIVSRINTVSPSLASLSGSFLRLSATSTISIGSGSANGVLGLSPSQSAYLRNTSPTYTSWLANLNTQNSQNNTMISNLNTILSNLNTQMQDYWTGHEQAFDEAKAYYPVVQALINATNSRISEINADLTMDVNIDANLTTRRDTKNPNRVSNLTTFLNTTSGRVSQIEATLTRENLFNKRYAWLTYRADRGTGTIPSIYRAVDDQIKAAAKAAIAKTMSTV